MTRLLHKGHSVFCKMCCIRQLTGEDIERGDGYCKHCHDKRHAEDFHKKFDIKDD